MNHLIETDLELAKLLIAADALTARINRACEVLEPLVLKLEHPQLRSLSEAQSEREAQEEIDQWQGRL